MTDEKLEKSTKLKKEIADLHGMIRTLDVVGAAGGKPFGSYAPSAVLKVRTTKEFSIFGSSWSGVSRTSNITLTHDAIVALVEVLKNKMRDLETEFKNL